MFWKIECEPAPGETADLEDAGGRFVLHRHRDAGGPHLDLRLECGDCLMGWRIDADSLEGAPWATEKAPHDRRWLEQSGDAVRVDAGVYRWLEPGGDERVLLLHGQLGVRLVRARRVDGLPPTAVRAVCEALREGTADAHEAGRLIIDGVTARRRAVERFCGLGRELDGAAFDGALWRKTLANLTLDEIQVYLHAYEVRFDAKYPPSPVSRPEPLPERDHSHHKDRVMAILREPTGE